MGFPAAEGSAQLYFLSPGESAFPLKAEVFNGSFVYDGDDSCWRGKHSERRNAIRPFSPVGTKLDYIRPLPAKRWSHQSIPKPTSSNSSHRSFKWGSLSILL